MPLPWKIENPHIDRRFQGWGDRPGRVRLERGLLEVGGLGDANDYQLQRETLETSMIPRAYLFVAFGPLVWRITRGFHGGCCNPNDGLHSLLHYLGI